MTMNIDDPQPATKTEKAPKKMDALKAAFPHTIPVFTGFTFLGLAYGILMYKSGYGVGWTFLFSLLVFAGSGQYLAITFLTTVFNPLHALLMTLMINARHLFYGISMLERYRNTGKLKPYLIFGLCDETFSIACTTKAQEGVEDRWFLFFITLLDHMYWIFGSVLGGLLGAAIPFNTTGLDFVLTALFTVIFVDQWKKQGGRRSAAIGILSSVASLLVFGPDGFLLPAMAVILVALSLLRLYDKSRKNIIEESTP
ncbi:AzlC family ABC transporter permease [Alkalibacter rhizosphaerae]|nr:AzlC family ABC transporter permease [Alkalibacter rhizosphaerae]